MPTDVLIAGCGDLGSALAQDLDAQGYHVVGLRRSDTASSGGVRMLAGDVTRRETLEQLAEVRPKILVYSVAASEQSDEAYRSGYVDGLRNTLSALTPSGSLRHVFFVSSTRPYGQTTDQLLDEQAPALASDFGGRRLLEAEALLATAPCPATVLRLSGIYGPGRTRMLSLAARPATWPAGNSWTNRIHRDDAAAFISFLIERTFAQVSLENLYIVTDSVPAPQHAVLRWIAQEMGITDLPDVPVVQGGKRLGNARMLSTGFQLRYPGYREGYAKELREFLMARLD